MKKRFNINLDDSAFTKERSPPKSHFRSSSNPDDDVSSSSSSVVPTVQPLSYAEYVVQQKNISNISTDGPSSSKLPRLGDSSEAHSSRSSPQKGVETPEARAESADQPEDDGAHESGSVQSLGPKPVGSGSSIIVSPRQRGNPILKYVRSVPWEFGEVVPDYVLGQTTCALFLSLRYHNLNPNYIHERLKQLGSTFVLRVLLLQVDVKDPHHALKELARICIMADCTLVLAWSPEEAGRYLETYKSYEKKPADLLKEQVEKNYLSKVTDCMTTVKSINKTDALTLLSTFSSVEGIIRASKEDLVLCPGLGPQKARRLHDVLHKPFLKSKTKDD
ncbi:DNA excision repair protein ERCC-1 isoform X2 [Boleophthalmus pectinirostris]|uniref:DNA excision repair protein ERCC-1 isoform X2 n=1 Tax=Boleophthalmus pectinirostris TaxID=150288 RepID=UPI00242B2D9A|nr:DNA excision repair protein ERCC-1 isoform X2 [Boleophthalmus pectinirostris]